jgi:hypothetical protein
VPLVLRAVARFNRIFLLINTKNKRDILFNAR